MLISILCIHEQNSQNNDYVKLEHTKIFYFKVTALK